MYIAHTLFSELREYTVFAFMEAAGLLLFGVWLKSDIEESWVIALLRKNPKICLKLDALENRKREKKVLPIDLLGGADKLRIYKELLDCGSITQEEFDEKKRQILGT